MAQQTQSVGKPPGLPKAAQGFSGTLPGLWHTHTHAHTHSSLLVAGPQGDQSVLHSMVDHVLDLELVLVVGVGVG